MSGKDVEIISEIRTTEGTESSNGDARTELTSEEDSESSDSVDHYTTNEPRPQFYRPCCTTMQTAMYLIGGGEVLIYLAIIGVYTIFYNGFMDSGNYEHFKGQIMLEGLESVDEESADGLVARLAMLCLAQILVCCLCIFASIFLIIGAAKRRIFFCILWIFLVSCFIISKVALAAVSPIHVFHWANVWILVELYFVYCAIVFIREIRCYPEGYTYRQKLNQLEFSEEAMHMVPIDDDFIPGEGKFARFKRKNSIGANRPILFYQSIA